MDLTFSDSDLSFRQEVIAFLNTEYPLDIKEKQDKTKKVFFDSLKEPYVQINEGWLNAF